MRLYDLLFAKSRAGGTAGTYQFAGNSNNTVAGIPMMTSLEIADGVTSIGDSAFTGCGSLTTLTIPNGVTSIGDSAFKGCSSLTTLTIPNGVISISGSAFRGCPSLTTLTIPNGVTSIGNYAFYDCPSLTTLTIPNSVISIRASAFSGCIALEVVDLTDFDGSSVPALGASAFSGLPENAKFIFASQAALDAFAANSGWSTYSQHFEVAQ